MSNGVLFTVYDTFDFAFHEASECIRICVCAAMDIILMLLGGSNRKTEAILVKFQYYKCTTVSIQKIQLVFDRKCIMHMF